MSDLKKYIREVSSLLECPDKEKEYYLSIIENDCADDEEELSYEELVERLGSPREWVNAHIDVAGGDAYEKQITNLRKTKSKLIWIISAIILLIAAVYVYAYVSNERYRGLYGYDGEAIIISIGP